MIKRNIHEDIRSSNVTVSKKSARPWKNYPLDPTVAYNGACAEYEDPADYLPRGLAKGVRLA